MDTLKIKQLLPGSYTVTAFEPVQSMYGQTYKVSATHESGENIIFWSNSFLSTYINKTRLRQEFDIILNNGRISIPGYSPVTKLMPKNKVLNNEDTNK